MRSKGIVIGTCEWSLKSRIYTIADREKNLYVGHNIINLKHTLNWEKESEKCQ